MTRKRLVLWAVPLALFVAGVLMTMGSAVSTAQEGRPHTPGGPAVPGGGPPAPPRPDQLRMMLGLVGDMKRICEDGVTSSILAIGSLKDDVRRKPDEIIKDLEDLLGEVGWLPTRNAIRLTLKELYKQQGEDEKLLMLMREMVLENDPTHNVPEGTKRAWPEHMFERGDDD